MKRTVALVALLVTLGGACGGDKPNVSKPFPVDRGDACTEEGLRGMNPADHTADGMFTCTKGPDGKLTWQ